jgi:hypothetical protein
MDIVKSNFPIRPKPHSLNNGKSWVDFAREIDAMTLFDTGFGNIIELMVNAAMYKT